ncbi:MAG: hypothetical protein EXS51_03880 [Candidatus Taylorbacteria bacterium]|nr:hypothetical protein [Candidatus Taylorbacteria bacterium]
MPKILFLFHGGTIGQKPKVVGNRVILVAPEGSKDFEAVCAPIIEKAQKENGIETAFEFITSTDSNNVSPNHWERLIFRVKKAQEDGYDAVGIVHGTDTMSYTVTAVALGLHGKTPGQSGLKIPVVFTGAQNPVYKDGGDGKFNLENLFRTILEAIRLGVADVMVNFWNRVMLAPRCLKVSEKSFDAFRSPAFVDIGYIDGDGVHLIAQLRKKSEAAEKLVVAPKFGRGVMSVELAPGLEPNTLLGFVANGGVSVLILKSLGEGNGCTEGEYSILPMIRQATTEFQTPVLITSKFVGGSTGAAHYETGQLLLDAGAVACFDHTDVAVDVKSRWLLGNGVCADVEGFRKAMGTSYAGEVTPPKSN